MTLAGMMIDDKEAWICDLAETYQIFDYRALPAHTLAVLSSGLREDSRIKMRQNGLRDVPLVMIWANIADTLKSIAYGFSDGDEPVLWRDVIKIEKERDGQEESARGNAAQLFDSKEAFDEKWREITERE